MIHEQDGIKYHIESGFLKGWNGDSPFKKPIWDGELIVEGWTDKDEAEKAQFEFDLIPTLAARYCDALGYTYGRDIDIQVDQIEAFKPREKVYNLLGQPSYKEYYYNDICVCRLLYVRVYEDRKHEGFTSNEFIGTKTRFIFYKDEGRVLAAEKEKTTKQFNLVPTLVSEDGEPVNVIWSSADREALLRSERYKSEQVMKAFNPVLYQLLVSKFNDPYMRYKETGDNTEIVAAVQAYDLPLLDGEVKDDDKKVIFGEMEQYPDLTVRGLILMALP